MKKYKLDFYDKCGCTTTREERIIIEANSLDEAREKAYSLPQARRYDNLIVGEYIEGMALYGVEILGVEYWEGKQAGYNVEIYLSFNAKSESDVRRYVNNNYIGKYSHSHTYYREGALYEDVRKDGQDTLLKRIVDIHQMGVPVKHLPTIE